GNRQARERAPLPPRRLRGSGTAAGAGRGQLVHAAPSAQPRSAALCLNTPRRRRGDRQVWGGGEQGVPMSWVVILAVAAALASGGWLLARMRRGRARLAPVAGGAPASAPG